MSLEKAFAEWRNISGLEVLDETEANSRYQKNTLGISRVIPGALRPKTVEEIQGIVKIAGEQDIKLYTFSTGHNWGFGSSLPTVDNCVIVDLSGMKKIFEFNEKLGYVTLEPGVTQQDLHEYMVKNNLKFMVPTTGGGPSCSLIGNALDKGYGITPHEDHFGAILSIEAVLASGEVYHSAFHNFGATVADKVYKWKAGPYLDGIFVQSNFGIVTQATIAMVRQPHTIGQFIAYVDKKDLQRTVESISKVKERFGSMVGGINLMNTHRLLAMVELKKEWQIDGVLSEDKIRGFAKKRKLPDWAILVGVYSPKELVSSIHKSLHQEFSYANRRIFLTRSRIKFLQKILRFLPNIGIKRTVNTIELAFHILEGVPTEIALPLAYIKNPKEKPEKNLHPDRDGCGELWYNPVLPMDGSLIENFTKEVVKIMREESFEPMITLTGVNQRYFASNIPIIFNRSDQNQCNQSRKCLDRLMALAEEMKVFPDRLDIETMRRLYDHREGPNFTVSQKIKEALDPKGIFSPGRYIKIK